MYFRPNFLSAMPTEVFIPQSITLFSVTIFQHSSLSSTLCLPVIALKLIRPKLKYCLITTSDPSNSKWPYPNFLIVLLTIGNHIFIFMIFDHFSFKICLKRIIQLHTYPTLTDMGQKRQTNILFTSGLMYKMTIYRPLKILVIYTIQEYLQILAHFPQLDIGEVKIQHS